MSDKEIDWKEVANHMYDQMKMMVVHCDGDRHTRFSLARSVAFEAIRYYDQVTGRPRRSVAEDWDGREVTRR